MRLIDADIKKRYDEGRPIPRIYIKNLLERLQELEVTLAKSQHRERAAMEALRDQLSQYYTDSTDIDTAVNDAILQAQRFLK